MCVRNSNLEHSGEKFLVTNVCLDITLSCISLIVLSTRQRGSRSMAQGREWRVTYRRPPTLTLLCSHFSSYRCTKANLLMTLLHGIGLKPLLMWLTKTYIFSQKVPSSSLLSGREVSFL